MKIKVPLYRRQFLRCLEAMLFRHKLKTSPKASLKAAALQC
jgi:hypothetical protein